MSSEDFPSDNNPEFDNFADHYDAALMRGLRLTGESKSYFARKRICLLADNMENLSAKTASVLDFGCGTGSTTPFFRQHLNADTITGIDPSDKSLVAARKKHGSTTSTFINTRIFKIKSGCDLAYCNGVFHHIQIADRIAAASQVFDSLKPGGYFSFWENNPWNPMTRFIMNRVPFDEDAKLLWPKNARAILCAAGFEIVSTDFAFIFPAGLKFLRFLEHPLRKLPLGGQYHVLCKKPVQSLVNTD
ncbi:MAG: class I SAM-dependent methyltransferase [Verrucomicrobiales bacterium]|jgi:SAM-dependent methyltransferase